MESGGSTTYNPFTFVFQYLAIYGWHLVASCVVAAYILRKMRPAIDKWKQDREDAAYHKDPDMALARMEAIQRARERQQQMLLEASQRALELNKEREERKRQEVAEKLKKYGTASGGQRLGAEDDYLPLSGGASTSTYRPPKKSKCGGGGCGK